MKCFYSDTFVLPLPEGHRFPMAKYARLRERLVQSGVVPVADLQMPDAASVEQLCRVHDRDWVERVLDGRLDADEQRRIGFPWSPEMVERSRRSAGATIAAARAALVDGVAANLAGGTHHAHRDRGEGFCVFNDSAVAARAMQAEEGIARVLIVDCDVHQGNGTASIFAGDPSVFTCSIHGARNFPFRKDTSDLDVELPDGTGDADYLAALAAALDQSFASARPDLVIYLAGADPYAHDRYGRLALTRHGLLARDVMVLHRCWRHGVPTAVAMAGGYAPDIEDIVDIHFGTICTAAALPASVRKRKISPSTLSEESPCL